MNPVFVSLFSVFVFILPTHSTQDQKHSWESPWPIEKVQQMVRDLEADPLGKHADNLRAVLGTYFDNMRPEFVVCIDQFLPLLHSDKVAHKNLWLHVPISSGSFLLDHPEAIQDEEAYQLAGLKGMLRAYEKMIQVKPMLRHDFLEELLRLQDAGKLNEYVRQHMYNGDSSSNPPLKLQSEER
jgi:hypothetical protein